MSGMRKPWMLLAGLALILFGLGGIALTQGLGGGYGTDAYFTPDSSYVGPQGGRGLNAAPDPYGYGMMGRGYGMMGRGGRFGGSNRGVFTRVPRPTTFKSNGERIYFTGVSESGARARASLPMVEMMGLACADCHGADRKGDITMPDGTTVSENLTAKALEDWTRDDIEKAITDGIEPDGKDLNWWMPSWAMPRKDLEDVIDYLKTGV